jgi:ATP-dependent DNA helicase DinG
VSKQSASGVSPATHVLGPDGLLSRVLPGYEHRQSQLDMADAVTRAIEREQVLLVEAGTGTGKTLAYLVPALLSGKKVVISTGTKALQDQIMEHDVPLLASVLRPVLGRSIEVACMKGLSNYLCLRRYGELQRDALAESRYHRELPMLRYWAENTESGDRSELSVLAESSTIWSEVHSAADTRIGPKCVHHDACFVTKMRKRAQDADVVVVNHHLYFADLALRSGRGAAAQAGVIPDHDAVVFDEAHLIEDIATDFFGVSVSTTRLAVLVRDALRTFTAARIDREAEKLITRVTTTAATLFATLPQAAGDGARVPLSREAWSDRLQAPMLDLDSALDGLAAFCRVKLEHGEAIAQIARRADQARDDIATIAEGGGGDRVTWVIVRGKGVTFGASPIDVAEILRERLFMRARGVVLTSATLTTSGTFDYVRSRLGISAADGIVDFAPEERMLASPFDFGAQAALYVPEDMPDPREPSYLDAAEREIVELIKITGGGAFVLCTSVRVMRALAERLRSALELPVLVQGSAPHVSLIERFREHGNAVLVATASFWQGVDVPGRALRLVIIDKLPFDVPSDPLVAARCERLEAAGEKPFMKYLVPSAALTLKQGFGRLIRSAEDRGIVAILDQRITKKGYGRTFIASLPPASRCYSLAELRAFYASAFADRAVTPLQSNG